MAVRIFTWRQRAIVAATTIFTIGVFLALGTLLATVTGSLAATLIVAALASFPANAWLLTKLMRREAGRAIADLDRLTDQPPTTPSV